MSILHDDFAISSIDSRQHCLLKENDILTFSSEVVIANEKLLGLLMVNS
jgi:hypothetical protein